MSGITVLSIRADDDREFPTNEGASVPMVPNPADTGDQVPTDYLSSILRDLPWDSRTESEVSR